MNKNILALGLIAVISGISTAQTYTATAGTNGVTDIQSDYSSSTGDGASVSVDVPLEFELPKKVAIAVRDEAGAFTSNSLFAGILSRSDHDLNVVLDPSQSWDNGVHNNITLARVVVSGGIYSNTPVQVDFSVTDFIHETDSNSVIKSGNYFHVGKNDANVGAATYCNLRDDNDSSTDFYTASCSLDEAALVVEGNKFSFYITNHAFIDTIDPTDRAGKYLATETITLTTL